MNLRRTEKKRRKTKEILFNLEKKKSCLNLIRTFVFQKEAEGKKAQEKEAEEKEAEEKEAEEKEADEKEALEKEVQEKEAEEKDRKKKRRKTKANIVDQNCCLACNPVTPSLDNSEEPARG